MYKAIFLGVSAAFLLGACTSATGPRFNAYVVSDSAGAKSYKVECHGLFEGAGVCRDKAQEICGDQKVHVLKGVGPLAHDDDVRTLVFQCGEPEQPAAATTSSAPIRLSADTLFAFDRSDQASMTEEGRQQLSQLALSLNEQHGRSVTIVGYTDRLGGSDYNQRLSEARAKTVGDYLIVAGLPASDVHTEGRGANDPLVECRQGDRKALIACLAPNRRVEVSVTGSGGA
ncbi:hypothetical protein WS70_08775 [Burkholderia mayonis]|uniref:OmpA-like domain-containing protein n=1 Tax=Burkholderia mayonis TaxID=1385591 RepID=A0A1B4FDX3_9BURK|nr:OmpA family protein [Burkholderia mayonis]AOJ01910.1 hypothetical protein WS70_08775 [Burkholderia mayonis]KVE46051.1 hypothetical protein WS70_03175 [Burkholderia mayonis]